MGGRKRLYAEKEWGKTKNCTSRVRKFLAFGVQF